MVKKKSGGQIRQFCKYGHDTFVGGRNKNSRCRECVKNPPPTTKQFCLRGHDTFVTGRNRYGKCDECGRIDARQYYIDYPKHQKEYLQTEAGRTSQRNAGFKAQGIFNKDGTQFTVEDWNKAFALQNGRCKLKTCNKHESELAKPLEADHNHVTGKFRGLLCHDCNINRVGKLTREQALEVADYLAEK